MAAAAKKSANHPPKKAGTPADFIALREYAKLVLSGFRPVGKWRTGGRKGKSK